MYLWFYTFLQKRNLVLKKVSRQEDAKWQAKAILSANQSHWTKEGYLLGFLLRATYALLPIPHNLKQWLEEDNACSICQAPATLQNILTGYK